MGRKWTRKKQRQKMIKEKEVNILMGRRGMLERGDMVKRKRRREKGERRKKRIRETERCKGVRKREKQTV